MKNERIRCFNYNGSISRNNVVFFGIPDITEIPPLVTVTAFNQIDVEERLLVPEAKPDIEQINSVILQICLESAFISNDFNKIFIKGIIWQKITYTACDSDQPVHTFEKEVPFSHFIDISDILIPNGIDLFNVITLAPEDAIVQKINGRTVFKDILVLAILQLPQPTPPS